MNVFVHPSIYAGGGGCSLSNRTLVRGLNMCWCLMRFQFVTHWVSHGYSLVDILVYPKMILLLLLEVLFLGLPHEFSFSTVSDYQYIDIHLGWELTDLFSDDCYDNDPALVVCIFQIISKYFLMCSPVDMARISGRHFGQISGIQPCIKLSIRYMA